MGVRGEVFSTKVTLENRTYFFNVKENRTGDLFLNIVESKPNEGDGFERHQIVLFADDMKDFLKGLDDSLRFMEKEISEKRKKYYAAAKAARADSGAEADQPKRKVFRKTKGAEDEWKPRPDPGRGEYKSRTDSSRGEYKPRQDQGREGYKPRKAGPQSREDGSSRYGSRPGKPAYQGGSGPRRQGETGSRFPGAPGYKKPAFGGKDRVRSSTGEPDYASDQRAFHKMQSDKMQSDKIQSEAKKPRQVRAVKPKTEGDSERTNS